MSNPVLLTVEGLTVAWGQAPAVRDVSIEVSRGEAVALIGANGAGKTSLLSALVGATAEQGARVSGRILLGNRDLSTLAADARIRAGLGWSPEGRRVFPGLTVWENLLVGCPAGGRARRRRLDRVHALFPDLARHRGRRAWQLSGGQQQMLAIGRALMGDPALLLLDEPTLGLAPELIEDLTPRLRDLTGDGMAILVAEQNETAAAAIATRAYRLHAGAVVETGPTAWLCKGLVP